MYSQNREEQAKSWDPPAVITVRVGMSTREQPEEEKNVWEKQATEEGRGWYRRPGEAIDNINRALAAATIPRTEQKEGERGERATEEKGIEGPLAEIIKEMEKNVVVWKENPLKEYDLQEIERNDGWRNHIWSRTTDRNIWRDYVMRLLKERNEETWRNYQPSEQIYINKHAMEGIKNLFESLSQKELEKERECRRHLNKKDVAEVRKYVVEYEECCRKTGEEMKRIIMLVERATRNYRRNRK